MQLRGDRGIMKQTCKVMWNGVESEGKIGYDEVWSSRTCCRSARRWFRGFHRLWATNSVICNVITKKDAWETKQNKTVTLKGVWLVGCLDWYFCTSHEMALTRKGRFPTQIMLRALETGFNEQQTRSKQRHANMRDDVTSLVTMATTDAKAGSLVNCRHFCLSACSLRIMLSRLNERHKSRNDTMFISFEYYNKNWFSF